MSQDPSLLDPQAQAAWLKETLGRLRTEVGKAVVGQAEVIEGVLVCLASHGHVLLEGMPGLGKTLLVKSLSQALGVSFNRIQFTPDMMPADVTGTNILRQEESGARSFEFKQGPIFASFVLADEINRATPKTQSALLEAMQERAVTAGGQRRPLPDPFLVMATQNPIEQEGTYPLPEAQLDRFFFKILVSPPSKKDLAEIVARTTGGVQSEVTPVATGEDIRRLQALVRQVPIAPSVLDFALSLVVGTHPDGESPTQAAKKWCRCGASPRAAQSIVTAAKVFALSEGRYNASREDVVRAALPALRHRIILGFEAAAEGLTADMVVQQILDEVKAGQKDPISLT